MGGRGAASGRNFNQMGIEREVWRSRVEEIRNLKDELRASMLATGGNSRVSIVPRKKQCFCCEEYTLPASSVYVQCEICGWIDDPYQNLNPDSLDGKNKFSLDETRRQYQKRVINNK